MTTKIFRRNNRATVYYAYRYLYTRMYVIILQLVHTIINAADSDTAARRRNITFLYCSVPENERNERGKKEMNVIGHNKRRRCYPGYKILSSFLFI